MITSEEFGLLVRHLGEQGETDIEWAENVREPTDATTFALEAIWVICNSGMRYAVARKIESRVLQAIHEGRPVAEAFGHKGKATAMQYIWDNRENLFGRYICAEDKLAFLESLPWIGGVTKFQLAKNFGMDFAKPDIHLQRLGNAWESTPHEICERLARQTGYRIGTVDLILWRACATGLIDSRSGSLRISDRDCHSPDSGT